MQNPRNMNRFATNGVNHDVRQGTKNQLPRSCSPPDPSTQLKRQKPCRSGRKEPELYILCESRCTFKELLSSLLKVRDGRFGPAKLHQARSRFPRYL